MEQVVVVGAGPVGLWLACELQMAGVSALVLEQAVRRSPHSKALGLQPRTVEVLAMRGLEKQFLDGGVTVPSGHFGMLDSRLDYRPLDTRYPFQLMHPQVRTEEILERRARELGARILRGHTVTGLTQEARAVRVQVNGGDGDYAVPAGYVVGCDGAGSTVRTSAGIGFAGTDATVFGYLGDVMLDTPPAQSGFNRFSPDGAVLIAPMPGGLYRVAGVDPARQDVAGTELTLAELRESVTRAAGSDFGMRDPVWLSRFGNASRLAETYRQGRVLLAGDAAHMHFPTGGVGLNVGLQDAMNLGWKLAAEIQGRAPADLLDSYHAERYPAGVALLENSAAQTAVLTAFSAAGIGLRTLLSKLIAAQPHLGRTLAEQLSGLDVRYPPTGPTVHPLAGTRAPDLPFVGHPGPRLFDFMHNGRPVLLNLSGTALTTAMEQASARGIGAYSGRLADPADPAWAAVGAAIIRPDGHVWWAADKSDQNVFDRATWQAMSSLGAF